MAVSILSLNCVRTSLSNIRQAVNVFPIISHLQLFSIVLHKNVNSTFHRSFQKRSNTFWDTQRMLQRHLSELFLFSISILIWIAEWFIISIKYEPRRFILDDQFCCNPKTVETDDQIVQFFDRPKIYIFRIITFDRSLCKLGPEHLLLFKSDSKQIETLFRIQNTVSNYLCDQFSWRGAIREIRQLVK